MSINKIIEFLNSDNIAELIDEDKYKKIVDDVSLGYKIDKESCVDWLETNKKAIEIIKNCDSAITNQNKNFPFDDASSVIYPLISPAVIQLSSRIIQHIVRNDKVAECAVMGKDQDGSKQERAKRVSNFLSYEYLIESDSWLTDEHKICMILASWGTAFKRVYYNPVTRKICSEILPSEDVIIHNDTTSIEKARRITVRNYMTKNDLIEKIRSGQFLEVDFDKLKGSPNNNNENNPQEINPVYEILEQFCYLDLDEDEYEEPYIVYIHEGTNSLLGIYPAYELKDVEVDSEQDSENFGDILKITPRIYIVDYHLIDDPEGKFYSIGLNQLLYHQNKSVTTILRQLVDAGTLSNASSCSGFVTKAFKTRERNIRIKLGEFQVIEANPQIDLEKQIMNLPFREPSQVLLALLQMLIEGGKETGFITDTLTGDVEGQNTPATTMLAMVEQGTRAFKPIIQKLYCALKKEFKMWFHLHATYSDQEKYFRFQDLEYEITQDDFDEQNLDICPVADPTMSSEAHKYAKIHAVTQALQTPLIQSMDIPYITQWFFSELDLPTPENFLAKEPPAPDPKMVEIQSKIQMKEKDHEISLLKQQIAHFKAESDRIKVLLKSKEVDIKAKESYEKQAKMAADAAAAVAQIGVDKERLNIEEYRAETERQKVHKEPSSK